MNRKGFTLIELIATILILGLVVGITVYSVSGLFKDAKNKTEDVFVETIKDSLDIYLTSNEAKNLSFSITCSNNLNKIHGTRKVYKGEINFSDVINSEYKPIKQDDLVNPANDDVECKDASEITISVYRDEDYVYYYSVDKDAFGCFVNNLGNISNLPEGFVC